MTLDTDKLAKVLALASSDKDGEALAALRMAQSMLGKAGLDFKDVAERVKTPSAPSYSWSPPPPPPRPKGYTVGGCTWESKAAYDQYCANARARHEAERLKHAPSRAAVLARYGSVEAAVARDEREQLLHAAVAKWLKKYRPDNTGCPGRWHKSLDGWSRDDFTTKPSARVMESIKGAFPLPTNLFAVKAELDYWRTRDDEICDALECWSDTQLDLPAYLRRDVVQALMEKDMPASTPEEVMLRLEFAGTEECCASSSEMIEVIIEDFRRVMTAPRKVRRPRPGRTDSRQLNILGLD